MQEWRDRGPRRPLRHRGRGSLRAQTCSGSADTGVAWQPVTLTHSSWAQVASGQRALQTVFTPQVQLPVPAFRNWVCLESRCPRNLILPEGGGWRKPRAFPGGGRGPSAAPGEHGRLRPCWVPQLHRSAPCPTPDVSVEFTVGRACCGKLPYPVTWAIP